MLSGETDRGTRCVLEPARPGFFAVAVPLLLPTSFWVFLPAMVRSSCTLPYAGDIGPRQGLLQYEYCGGLPMKMLARVRGLLLALMFCGCSVAGATSLTPNFSDLWWNPNESGWGLNISQQA